MLLSFKEIESIRRRFENRPAPSNRRDRDGSEVDHSKDHAGAPESAGKLNI
jgi:hypothetical protein